MALLSSGLSEAGRVKAEAIIALEGILGAIENDPGRRDSGLYYVAVFGEPSADKPWGWRVEGHHLSVNFTLSGGRIAATPSFMGANPAEVREGDHKGLRPLASEEDLARALAAGLAEAGKGVVFTDEPPREILTAAERVAEQLEEVGVAAGEMSAAQRKALMKLVGEYARRHRKEVAASDMAEIRKAGVGKIRFGWAGSLKPGEAYYYRVHRGGQHAERRQPHPHGVARPQGRLRARLPRRAHAWARVGIYGRFTHGGAGRGYPRIVNPSDDP
jgi:hypothetical protein